MNLGAERSTARRDAVLLQAVCALGTLALAFSSAAAVEYYFGGHAFCAPGSGCDVVRASAIGQTLGTGLPAVGVLGFALTVLAVLARRPSMRWLGLAAALTGGVIGALLLALQVFGLHALCSLCAGADLAAVACGLCALPLLRHARVLQRPQLRVRAAWHALLVLAALAAPAWTAAHPPQRPAYVRSLSKPGKINVIEFSDFECPFCRGLHPVLKAAIAPWGERVHFVRKSFPLPGHLHSREAARAYVCAAAQNEAEPMADWLFSADDVSAASCAEHAAALGLDTQRFNACTNDPATENTVARAAAAIYAADFGGLPTVWIGAQRIIGFDREAGGAPYAAALARAETRDDGGTRLRPLVAVLILSLLVFLPSLRRR